MKFIRKGGRIIPIRSPQEQGESQPQKPKLNSGKEIVKSAAIGATAGALTTGGMYYASAMKMPKLAKFTNRAGIALGVANFARAAYSANRQSKENGASGGEEFATQYIASALGANLGARASLRLLNPALKATIAAKKGIVAGYKAIKPHTAQFAEYRKYLKAKKVTSTVQNPIRGLLK